MFGILGVIAATVDIVQVVRDSRRQRVEWMATDAVDPAPCWAHSVRWPFEPNGDSAVLAWGVVTDIEHRAGINAPSWYTITARSHDNRIVRVPMNLCRQRRRGRR